MAKRGGQPGHESNRSTDSRELQTMRLGMARVVIDDAAAALAELYAPKFTPERARALILRAAEMVNTTSGQ